jgi:hypothetical protein
MAKWGPAFRKNKTKWLERQAEIDRENAANPGVTVSQMSDFRDWAGRKLTND